jgi:hypothetical protein
MRESERTVHETAANSRAREQRVCDQLLSNETRYSLWHMRHDHRMTPVARLRRREDQLLELRRTSIEQIHGAALVRYLRDYGVTGADRDATLRLFYGVVDVREAAIREHRGYLLSASSQLCASEVLALAGDTKGVQLVNHYERAYEQYLSLFCQRARAAERTEHSVLDELMPDVKNVATGLRTRIIGGHLLPTRTTVSMRSSAERRLIAERRRTELGTIRTRSPE